MPIGPVGAAAFLLVWLLLVGAMGYLMVEAFSFFAMYPWAFRHGPVVLRERRPSSGRQEGNDKVQFTQSGRFRLIAPNVAIFCYGRGWLDIRFRTMVPIKGTIVWRDGFADISGRLPIGSVLVPSFWLLGATVWSLMVTFSPDGGWKWLGVVPAAAAFVFIWGPAFLPLERRRVLKVADEILQRS